MGHHRKRKLFRRRKIIISERLECSESCSNSSCSDSSCSYSSCSDCSCSDSSCSYSSCSRSPCRCRRRFCPPRKCCFPRFYTQFMGPLSRPGQRVLSQNNVIPGLGFGQSFLWKRKFISSNRFNVNIGKKRNFFSTYLKHHVSLLEKEKVLCLETSEVLSSIVLSSKSLVRLWRHLLSSNPLL